MASFPTSSGKRTRNDAWTAYVPFVHAHQVDLTVGMLERLLLSAGYELHLTWRSLRSPQLGDLTQAWATDPIGQDRPERTHIRGFLDYLTLNPDAVAVAVAVAPSTAQMPEPSGSDFMDNLWAGIAEKACDDAGIARPSWTRHVAPLTQRWASPGTPRMRQRAQDLTPPQLARRGICMTSDSLWRNLHPLDV
jgi:hypothetical protein